jgi:hypothetical protein
MRKNRNIIMNTDTMLDILLSAAELFPIPCSLRISFSIHYCMDRITDSKLVMVPHLLPQTATIFYY